MFRLLSLLSIELMPQHGAGIEVGEVILPNTDSVRNGTEFMFHFSMEVVVGKRGREREKEKDCNKEINVFHMYPRNSTHSCHLLPRIHSRGAKLSI